MGVCRRSCSDLLCSIALLPEACDRELRAAADRELVTRSAAAGADRQADRQTDRRRLRDIKTGPEQLHSPPSITASFLHATWTAGF